MKLLLISVVVFICVTTVDCQENKEEENEKEKKCLESLEKGHYVPFYYGTTNLACIKPLGKGKGKGKRSLDTVSVTRLTHRFLYYCGTYYELVYKDRVYGKDPVGPDCDPEVDSEPAGYSNVTPDCAKYCAEQYARKKYHTLNNNCHHFANAMARFLYYNRSGKGRSCPIC